MTPLHTKESDQPQPAVIQPAFSLVAEAVARAARADPERVALVDPHGMLTYRQLDERMDRIAAALQQAGVAPRSAIALCANASVEAACVFLGALRAGVAVAPLAPGTTAASLRRMVQDVDAQLLFIDATGQQAFGDVVMPDVRRIALHAAAEDTPMEQWLAPLGSKPQPVAVQPDWPFNIIYSSGTTGTPKGIVQGHGMRWAHVERGARYGYGPESVALLSTPLYSNTTLVVFFPTIANGGCVVLMPKFDAAGYLALAQRHRATHTMLVPVQYQRLMARPDFDSYDLSSFQFKFSTSAPFHSELKADVLARWPGGLVEFYGMTEGGGTCILEAHLHPDKLHTVGQPATGSDIRLIDAAGQEVPAGEMGEVVGHSASMMTGYHRLPEKTREAEWFDPSGKRFIRTGDVGRFDVDGFLTLMDRQKDMVISGGFNIYPSDLEAVLRQHPAVAEAAVVGMPSPQWGETPVAFVVRASDEDSFVHAITADALLQWANAQLGKTQRIARLHWIAELPRSAIGKVLKRELRERPDA